MYRLHSTLELQDLKTAMKSAPAKTAQPPETFSDRSAAAKAAFANEPRFVDFLQTAPTWGNPYQEDTLLRESLAALVPVPVLASWTDDLTRLGARVAADGDITAFGNEAEVNHPRLEQYDAWGKRVDVIHTCGGWKQLHVAAATEGIAATAYETPDVGEQWTQRVRQMVKLYLYNPSSAIYSCPMAMTDGAATLIRDVLARDGAGSDVLPSELKQKLELAFANLTTRDPGAFWTSGQWMTERPGGSDVSRTETQAIPIDTENRIYALRGFKWFSSATECNMTMALARVGNDPTLSLFFIELRPNGDGKLNGIEIVRLKNKVGTKALPTAELRLDGCVGYLIGQRGRGVPEIVRMINVTRIYNSVCAVSYMSRMLAIAKDYANKRQVFGKLLRDLPLHQQTLGRVELEVRGNVLFALYMTTLHGRADDPAAAHERFAFDGLDGAGAGAVLRMLTPILKLYTGKQAVVVMSEGIELIGGNGYIEDSGVPKLLRDAQVLAIWEGTTNVLSLDVVRVLRRSIQAWTATSEMLSRLASGNRKVEVVVGEVVGFVMDLMSRPQHVVEMNARTLAFNIAHVTIAALMCQAGMDCNAWIESHPVEHRIVAHKL
ncbi:hypothetical protein BC828DRAFT_387919 [Blastocladiella britannica]|nr:hypothetical protein BC828DRAFT_387919 [Blastocladiella britannica]